MNTFHWPKLERSSWWLAGFIFISLFLHSTAFFLFHATVPIRPPTPKSAQPVQLLTPYGPDGAISDENVALLEWIATEDPALVAQVPDARVPQSLGIPYRPSYLTMRTAPLDVPDEPASVQFPSAKDPLSLIMDEGSASRPAAQPVPLRPTQVRFSGALANRAPVLKLTPANRSDKALEPTCALLGVDAEGEVKFVYPQRPGSGNAALDHEALEQLRRARFSPAANAPVAWGFAVVQWGDDAITSTPSE